MAAEDEQLSLFCDSIGPDKNTFPVLISKTMENITRSIGELSAEDSGSSQEIKVDELNHGDSQTSTENGDASTESVSGVGEVASASTTQHTITTRSSKKVSVQQQKEEHSYPIPSSSASAMEITEAVSAGGFVVAEHTTSTRSCRRRGAALNKHNQTMKFMENFDPEQSNRERKKLTRQITSSGKRKPTLYDEKGVMIASEVDLCDCLDESCPGCHFPCPKCHSNKCGHECRQNRRWTYEEIWVEGTNQVVTNPLIGIK